VDWNVHVYAARDWRDEFGVQTPRSSGSPVRLTEIPVFPNGSIPLHVWSPRALIEMRRFRPDVAYVYHEPFGIATAELFAFARGSGVPVLGFHTAQNLRKRYPAAIRIAERFVCKNASFATAVSAEATEALRWRGFRGPVSRFDFSLDLEKFEFSERSFRPPVRLGFLGRLVEAKGVDVALDAVRNLSDRGIFASFQIAGIGPHEGELRSKVSQMGLGDRVSFAGRLSPNDVPTFYKSIDLLIVPSITTAGWKEQFGRVVIEAAASGVPVVASTSGELPGLVDRLKCGWTSAEGDPVALSSLLADLISRPARLSEVARAGRAMAVAAHSESAVAGQLVDAIGAALEAKRS